MTQQIAMTTRDFHLHKQNPQHEFAQHQDTLATLGKLTAGIAHELNNPTMAIQRSAKRLRTLSPALQKQLVDLVNTGVDGQLLGQLLAWRQNVAEQISTSTTLPAVEAEERTAQLGNWLFTLGFDDAWDAAESFVSMHIYLDDLQKLVATLPTAHIVSVLRWLQQSFGVTTLLQEIEKAAQHITNMVAAIKTQTHIVQETSHEVDVHKSIEVAVQLISHKLKRVKFGRRYAADLPLIHAKEGDLQQVWINLLDNAIDASDGQGEVCVHTYVEENEVVIEVLDQGSGIPTHVMPHIFEPFFTTKAKGIGIGLGLEIAKRVIDEHHGKINVHSKPGATRFVVRLPIG